MHQHLKLKIICIHLKTMVLKNDSPSITLDESPKSQYKHSHSREDRKWHNNVCLSVPQSRIQERSTAIHDQGSLQTWIDESKQPNRR